MSRLAERREAHILTLCTPHLEKGESVTHWIRARRPGGGREGFAYLTQGRLVVYWLGGLEIFVANLADIRSWGLSSATPGGPVLAVETSEGDLWIQFPTGSEAVTTQVKRFLEAFVLSSPRPSQAPNATGDEIPSLRVIDGITAEKRSWGHKSRRIVVTVLGVALTILGIVLAVPLVPGPGLLVAIGGVALLATEYDWAKDALNWAQDKSRGSRQRLQARRRRPAD
ncbi:MAG: PGPGW domain-containing protein [Actinomycetota bacterium]|nr:PGPGW domain-containing protein [Actinomycetota bacterium]